MASGTFRLSGGLQLGAQSSSPSSPQQGLIYFDSSATEFRLYNGSGFVEIADFSQLGNTSGANHGSQFIGTNSTYSYSNITPASNNVQAVLEAIDSALGTAGGSEFADNVFRIQDNADATKEIAFEASAIATSTTRTITMPNSDVDLGDIAGNAADIADLVSLSGVAANSTNLGTFTGATISDSQTVKAALQDLETALEEIDANADDLISLSGVAENATDLGTFTGTTIADNVTIKAALQALETAVETGASSADLDDLVTLTGVAANSTDLGTFTGSTIADNETIKGALQDLETALELKADEADVVLRDGSQAFTADQSMGGNKLTNLGAPTAGSDAATKTYVDSVAEGLKPKEAVRVASTANVDISTGLENGDSIDGVTLATGDRVLLKDQTAPEENGIYVVVASGAASRSTDMDSLTPIDEVNGASVPVQEGNDNEGKIFVQTGGVSTLGTDANNFVFFNSSSTLVGGDGITISGSNVSVDQDGEGLTFVSNQLALELDGSTLSKSGSGLRVAALGITNAEISNSAAIAYSKLSLSDSIVNADINASAAIAYSKLNLANSIVNADISASAAIAYSKLDLAGQILDADINASAAIAGSKIDPDFGSQNVQTSGLYEQGSASDTVEVEYVHGATLTGSATGTVQSDLTFDTTAYKAILVEYTIVDTSSEDRRSGMLIINGDNASAVASVENDVVDYSGETGDVGVTWSTAMNGNNLEVRYDTTANNKTMNARIVRFRA